MINTKRHISRIASLPKQTFRVLSAFTLFTALSLLACNPVSENTPDNICQGIHNAKPHFSMYCHGARYRFPRGYCTEPNCHGANLRGGNSGAPSCYKCHDDRWSIFTTTHTLKIHGYYHHYLVDQGNLNAVCGTADCHGADLTGVAGKGYSCYACHTPIPIPGHRVILEGARHHINYCLLPHLSYCGGADCHGTTASLNNGAGTPCANCHGGVPGGCDD